MGYVYFIEAEGRDLIKIGYSKSPHSRRWSLATGTVERLRVVDLFRAAPEAEAQLHAAAYPWRAAREWFHYDEAIEEIIEEIDDARREAWLAKQLRAGRPFDPRWPGLETVDCTLFIAKFCGARS